MLAGDSYINTIRIHTRLSKPGRNEPKLAQLSGFNVTEFRESVAQLGLSARPFRIPGLALRSRRGGGFLVPPLTSGPMFLAEATSTQALHVCHICLHWGTVVLGVNVGIYGIHGVSGVYKCIAATSNMPETGTHDGAVAAGQVGSPTWWKWMAWGFFGRPFSVTNS